MPPDAKDIIEELAAKRRVSAPYYISEAVGHGTGLHGQGIWIGDLVKRAITAAVIEELNDRAKKAGKGGQMAKPITTVFTDHEIERIELLIVRSQNNGDASLATECDVVRYAVLAYIDWREKLDAGDLDGLPATALILETVPRLDPRKELA